jgi:hypothetical protein
MSGLDEEQLGDLEYRVAELLEEPMSLSLFSSGGCADLSPGQDGVD